MIHTTNFLGIPIEGARSYSSIPQRSQEELEPLVRKLLDDELVVDFGWRQYTPYFNDGDPCIFHASEIWIRTTEDFLDGDNDEEPPSTKFSISRYSTHPTLGCLDWETRSDNRPYKGNHESTWRAALELSEAIDSGAFNHVLLDLFGDHAEVTISKSDITVEFYEHD